ncbi:putative Heterokaryon incompatibility domain-containing protein [Seiridium cardinale]|uniref:Heterokaryon incompatibility domain-containing protein n=1 Tax=Seiridium cardinale TaxID=138064 RepID=A0ABR2XXP7_9PEZI
MLPKRLIYTESLQAPVRLIHTSSLEGEAVRYAALSHCWGEQLPLRTTADNEASFEEEIPHEIIPKTFHDAIEVSRRLDIKYLWIDALCIQQDDPVEWRQEAAIMKDVYARSVLTIAAASARNSHDGCFPPINESIPVDLTQFEIKSPDSDSESLLVRAHWGDTQFLTENAPLSTRGWVLQEQVLPKRIIYCMSPEFHWQCQCLYETESGVAFTRQERKFLPALIKGPAADQDDIWYRLMDDYSTRHFTFPRDRLAALVGIVEQFSIVSGDRHILACWERSLARGLLWVPLKPEQTPHPDPFPGIPSWSWLSRFESIQFEPWRSGMEKARVEYHTKLLDWDVSWAGTPLLSDITSAVLFLEGPIQVITLSVAPEARAFNPPYLNVGDELLNFDKGSIPWHCVGRFDHSSNPPKSNYACLLVQSRIRYNDIGARGWCHETFLMLELVAPDDPASNTYRRIGIANFHGVGEQFNRNDIRQIRLI